eukprot:TRINITY_DN14862_c0_g1_i1.p1 TRINITY_DN14862_c0_g1~~TRINITY_DN14862_c0_g1_i1.p1  ORF type:complete len:377 (-),score=41.71 TRINITY_DN14862_c0_g1_i1:134-1264(-)
MDTLSEKSRAVLIRNPPVYFTYVGAIDDEFECPVCRIPFCSPQVHEPCGNCFCQNCADQLKNCPFCRMKCQNQLKPSNTRLILNVLDKLIVKCNDCNLTFPRAQFEDHHNSRCKVSCPSGCGDYNRKELLVHLQETCPGMVIKCNNTPCKTTFPRRESEKHAQICGFHSMICPNNCGTTVFRKDSQKHLNLCNLVQVNCPRLCGRTILRKDIANHDLDCVEVETKCRAADLGCDVKAKRRTLASHEAICPLLKVSLKLTEILAKFQSVEENLKADVKNLKEQVASKDKEIKQLKTKVKIQKKQFGEQINRLNTEIGSIEKIGGKEIDAALIRAEMIKRQQCEEMKNFRAYVAIKEKEIVMGAYNANLYTVLEQMAA